jgi:hypothetical protein
MIRCSLESSAFGAACRPGPNVCLIVCGCACSTGTSAASMIGRTILITAVVHSRPSASGNEAVLPALAKPREQKWVMASSGISSRSSRQRSSASTTSV